MSNLTFTELETLYDELAMAMDQVGPEQHSVFLAKLVLCMAQNFGNAARISELIRDCQHEPVAELAPGQRVI